MPEESTTYSVHEGGILLPVLNCNHSSGLARMSSLGASNISALETANYWELPAQTTSAARKKYLKAGACGPQNLKAGFGRQKLPNFWTCSASSRELGSRTSGAPLKHPHNVGPY